MFNRKRYVENVVQHISSTAAGLLVVGLAVWLEVRSHDPGSWYAITRLCLLLISGAYLMGKKGLSDELTDFLRKTKKP